MSNTHVLLYKVGQRLLRGVPEILKQKTSAGGGQDIFSRTYLPSRTHREPKFHLHIVTSSSVPIYPPAFLLEGGLHQPVWFGSAVLHVATDLRSFYRRRGADMAEPPAHDHCNPNRPANRRIAPFSNRILSSLPKSNRELFHAVKQVSLQTGTVLYEPDQEIDHVYFLHDALVSVMCLGTDGSTVEIGLIGRECVVGIPAINCYHPLQQRLCRWILVARDGARSDSLEITHETISRLLGARRASITLAAGLLQKARLIESRRGKIHVLDGPGLEKMACECYGILKETFGTNDPRVKKDS